MGLRLGLGLGLGLGCGDVVLRREVGHNPGLASPGLGVAVHHVGEAGVVGGDFLLGDAALLAHHVALEVVVVLPAVKSKLPEARATVSCRRWVLDHSPPR